MCGREPRGVGRICSGTSFQHWTTAFSLLPQRPGAIFRDIQPGILKYAHASNTFLPVLEWYQLYTLAQGYKGLP